ncbi:MAG: NAD(P)-dependent oxidoreductase [Candidatus Margulisiibacteriota bacterium]
MKKKLLITCSKLITSSALAELESKFRVVKADCLLTKGSLKDLMANVDIVVIGGEEVYTLEVLKAANPGLKAIFIGIQGETSFTEDALAFLSSENLFATGGGVKQVARTTFREIVNISLGKPATNGKEDEVGELSKFSVSVIGAGNIGTSLIGMLRGKCRQLSYFNRQPKDDLAGPDIHFVPDIITAFDADIVTLHLKLVEETFGMVRLAHLKKIHDNGWLINNARADLVDPEDLLEYLEQGGRALFDVFYPGAKWSVKRDSALLQIVSASNFIFTNHTAAFSEETIQEYSRGLIDVIHKIEASSKTK